MDIKNCKFLRHFGINAIVLYPFVLYQDKEPSASIRAHESIHLRQIREDGFITFYSRYLLEYFRGRKRGLSHYEAYRNISYEKEAYDSVV